MNPYLHLAISVPRITCNTMQSKQTITVVYRAQGGHPFFCMNIVLDL